MTELRLPNEKRSTLEAEIGRAPLTILDFWASGCIPCISDRKRAGVTYELLKNYDVNTINISVDEKYLNWKNALDLHGFADNDFILTQPKNNIFLELLKVDTIPGIVILNADKKIQLLSAPNSQILLHGFS